jgi:hypothetical protein
MMNYTEEAERLLPCESDCCETHRVECPVAFRPAVAAALQAKDEKIAGLLESLDAHDGFITQLRAEVAKIKSEYERLDELYRSRGWANEKLIAERDGAIKSHCGTCDGSGVVDSGGITPWDAPIDMACPECKAKRAAAVVQGLEIAAKKVQYHRHRLGGVSADAFAICADMRDAIAAEIAKRKEELNDK